MQEPTDEAEKGGVGGYYTVDGDCVEECDGVTPEMHGEREREKERE